ncbi:hypothetical protein PQX77_021225 [Marasmius sp. AFHP31]|nr:hypothetical protein PQX77_021225 [Marasmius sp. AFHP31]
MPRIEGLFNVHNRIENLCSFTVLLVNSSWTCISSRSPALEDSGPILLITELPEQRVALMEDVNAAFTHGLTREPDEEENLRLCDKEEKDKRMEEAKTVTSHQVVSVLVAPLNALDGISA